MDKMITVTKDSGANFRILRRLERQGLISICEVELENETPKIKKKIKPIGVFGQVKYGKAVFSSKESGNMYREILGIIGNAQYKDSLHLEAHIRNGFDYFVTEDNDFLGKRKELKKRFNVQIVTPEELEEIISKNNC